MIVGVSDEDEDKDLASMGVATQILGPFFLDGEVLDRMHVKVGGILDEVALDLDEVVALLGTKSSKGGGETGKVREVGFSSQDGVVENRVGVGT